MSTTPDSRGWGPPCTESMLTSLVIGSVNLGKCDKRIHDMFVAFGTDYNNRVEKLIAGQCGCYACRNIVGGGSGWSYHAWGLAMDFNSQKHPQHKSGTFTSAQIGTIKGLCATYGMTWGGTWDSGSVDEMHFEFEGTPNGMPMTPTSTGSGNGCTQIVAQLGGTATVMVAGIYELWNVVH